MSLAVIVPAHNEEAQIRDTIVSLLAQSVVPDRIIVVADNCTDRTVEIARTFPVTVMETIDNPHRKAGAMNQAWHRHAQDHEFVFTMDADTVLSPDFFELALATMDANPDVAGASACPMLKPLAPDATRRGEILWRLARLDFGGYMRMLARWKFTPEVLSGYGAIFRNTALHTIANSRDDGLPWATESIVEDYRISLDLRKFQYRIAIIPAALAFTDTPMTVKELWRQRLRWAGGTWEELIAAGWQPYTKRAWRGVLACIGSALMRIVAIITWTLAAALGVPIIWSWWWSIPFLIAVIDRLDIRRYTKNADWKDVLLIWAFVPMEFLSLLREAWTIRAAWMVARKKQLSW